jgi:hypothetical protein
MNTTLPYLEFMRRYGNGTGFVSTVPPNVPRANFVYNRETYDKRKRNDANTNTRPAKRLRVRQSALGPGRYIPRGLKKRRVSTLINKRGAKRRRVQVNFNRRRVYRNYDILKIDELRKKVYNRLRGSGHMVQVNRLIYNGTNVKNRNGNPVQGKNGIQVFPVSIRIGNAGHAVGVVKAGDAMYVFDPHGKNRSSVTDNMANKLATSLRINKNKVMIYNRNSPQEHNEKGVCFGFVTLFLTRVTPELIRVPNKNAFENIVSQKLSNFNKHKCNRLYTWMHRPMSYAENT